MVQGMSYLQLYYNKACTRELEKDSSGNYIFNTGNISNNASSPTIVNLWCKNNGSHTAYDVSLVLISSSPFVTIELEKTRIYSNEIKAFPIEINISNENKVIRNVILRFSYDSI